MTNKHILHITPHFGAGVGTVVLNYLSKVTDSRSFTHRAICLDYANQNAIEVAKNSGFSLLENMSKKVQEMLDLIADSDMVLIHWWNHPLLYDFLVRERLPASRVILWSHILGSPPPNNFTDKILRYPDMFVFTTPLSYKVKDVWDLSDKRKIYLRDVWSTGGLDRVKSIKPKEHSGFNIGYVGNVDYTKMHPDFLDICNRVDIPNVNFIIVGGPNGKQLEHEAERRGIAGKFKFTGFVSEREKWEYLSSFDIFGYPLAPHHYGTCDQVLQESMAVGIVPVVLANPMESYMVKDGITGIIAKNKNEYVRALQDLYHNRELRDLLSKNAKEYAIRTFSLENMANEWDKIFNEGLNFPKTVRKWEMNKQIKDISPKDVFLESLGDYGEDFISYNNAKNDKEKKNAMETIRKLAESANWQSTTKSTVHHYNYFFPDDKYLSCWSKIMKEYNSYHTPSN
ncbi:glycosyltransferase [Chloroflexota bacterium]